MRWMTMLRAAVLSACLAALALPALANVRLAEVFTDGLVLQRDAKVPVWGTADPGEKVTVKLCGQEVAATAGDGGKFRLDLAPLKAGGPFEMDVTGKNSIVFNTVYVGDVWLCYGQSNMQWEVYRATTAAEAAKESTQEIRLLHIHRAWTAADGDALQQFSAVGYYFGRKLHAKIHVPVGLIYGGEGGTPAEVWTPADIQRELGYTTGSNADLFYTDRIQKPLEPYAIKGVIWYQGENNAGNAGPYTDLMAGLIRGWRRDFQQGDFPFLFVQLARIGGPSNPPGPGPNGGWAQLRDAQTRTLNVPNTGMVVCFDVTNGNIHPPFKVPVGERLADLALSKVYGSKPACDLQCPLFDSVSRKGPQATLRFSNAEEGLKLRESAEQKDGSFTFADATTIKDLYLVHADGTFVPAKARIEGSTVVLDLKGEKSLPDVYYAWSEYPVGDIYNKAGLPLSPFRIVGLRMYPDLARDNTISLSANQPLDPKIAENPASYRIAAVKILKAELIQHGAGVRLTIDTRLTEGQSVTIKLPGFKSWDGVTPVPDLSFTVLPGRLASGGLIQDFLVGETRQNIDMTKILADPTIDVTTFKPAVGDVWKLAESDTGLFDLLKWAGPYQNAVAFAVTNLFSDADRVVQLWLGSDDGVKAYVNGTAVWSFDKTRGLAPDSDKVTDVHLNKGWNTLLLEVSQGGGGWGVCARVMGDDGQPISGVSYSAVRP